MKISNQHAPQAPTTQGPKTAKEGELDLLKTLQGLVKPAAPATDPVMAALQALTGVQAPAVAADPVMAALQALTGVQAPTAEATPATTTARSSFNTEAPRTALTQPLLPNAVSPPNDDRLTRCFQDAWKAAYGTTKLPSREEREALLKMARELRSQHKNAVEIEYALLAHIKGNAGTGAVKATPAEARTAAMEAFQSTYRREPTPDEAAKWEAEANKLAEQGKDATTIKYALMTPMQQARDKVDPNDKDAMNNLAREAFKSVHAREPNPTELAHWADKATAMAKDGKDATTIKYALVTPMQEARDGSGRTDDPALLDLIKNAYREVLRDANRELSPHEEREWMKVAQKMRDEGKMNATSIKHMLIAEVRVAYRNL
ncbi:hypothetical protein ACLESD_24315 [Pyxidicoccus sp. 3LFB2]